MLHRVVGDVHLDFKLVPEAVLVGRVTTSEGDSVAGARVVAAGSPPALNDRELPIAPWDRDGKFRIAGPRARRASIFFVNTAADPAHHEKSDPAWKAESRGDVAMR